jgi:phage-related protein
MTTCQKLARTLTSHSTYSIFYFHPKVLAEIESWSVDLLADYARLVELLMVHGPDLRLPHSRAFGDGLFELRPKGKDGIGRAFYSFKAGKNIFILHAFVKKTQTTPDKDLAIARQRLKALRHD